MRRIGLALAVLTLVLDQLTKQWALEALRDPLALIEVTGWWNMVLVWNRGIGFGLFGGGMLSPLVLAAITGVIALGVAVWLLRTGTWLATLSAGLILGGAVGNIVDRLVYGAVVDFVDWHVSGYHWPVFNLADAAITLGVVLLIAESLFGVKPAPTSNSGREN